MLHRHHTWGDVEDKLEEIVRALIERFEKSESKIEALEKELAAVKAEPKVVNHNYSYYGSPVQVPTVPYQPPIWYSTGTGKMEMKSGR